MPANPVVFDDASATAFGDAVSLGPGQSLSIGYGETCAEGTCSAVLEVQTDPSWPAAEGVEGCSRIAPLRGVPTATISGAVVLFTADLAVTIHGTAEDLEKAKVAVDALREVGQARPTGVALPAPSARVTSVAPAWGRTSPTERSNILLRIADRMEQNLEALAVAETWDNGKPVRETLAADIPLAIDHFRYFAGVLRSQEGSIGELDENTVAYHFHEPLGVVAQTIPWNFPILMAVVDRACGQKPGDQGKTREGVR